MSWTLTVVAMRHGNKDGDMLTPKGEEQVRVAMRALARRGLTADLVVYSGANRTRQCADIAQSTLLKAVPAPHEDRGFHYDAVTEVHYGAEGVAGYSKELELLKASVGGKPTVAQALAFTDCPRLVGYTVDMQQQVRTAILELASMAVKDDRMIVLVFSHSPTLEMGVPDDYVASTPYGIGETDAIAFDVQIEEDGSSAQIVSVEFIPAPAAA